MTEITDEQRAAVEWLKGFGKELSVSGRSWPSDFHAKAILALLPRELTNPQPVLPTEPGAYHDARGTLTIIDPRGKWHGTYGDFINPDLCPGPFTRLVPERPQITRQQIEDILRDYHAEQETGLVHRLHALVNGADQ